jgi:ketosteroid isomerase-like protein
MSNGYTSLCAADLPCRHPEEREQIEHCLQAIFTAAETRDFVLLDKYHFYGPKFTKFSGTLPERLDADTCRRNEHEGLAAISNLKMQAEDLKIDVFGHVGIATFILDYSFLSEGVSVHKKDRSTLVFVAEKKIWKIVHEHLTPVDG